MAIKEESPRDFQKKKLCSTIYLLGILAHVDGEACDEVSDGLHHHFWISQHGLGHGRQQLLLQLGVSHQLQQRAQALKFNFNDLINYPKNTKNLK